MKSVNSLIINDTFIITSVIDIVISANPKSLRKSSFSVEDRIQQTIETINSIRKYIPNSEIILIEAGSTSFKRVFIEYVDSYIYIDNRIYRWLLTHKNKGFGEALILINFLMRFSPKKSNSSRLFKISGRYKLNSNFDSSKFDHNRLSFQYKIHKYPNSINPIKRYGIGNFNTVLYSVPTKMIFYYQCILYFSILPLLLNKSMETVFFYLIPKQLRYVFDNDIGVEGYISQTGESIFM